MRSSDDHGAALSRLFQQRRSPGCGTVARASSSGSYTTIRARGVDLVVVGVPGVATSSGQRL